MYLTFPQEVPVPPQLVRIPSPRSFPASGDPFRRIGAVSFPLLWGAMAPLCLRGRRGGPEAVENQTDR